MLVSHCNMIYDNLVDFSVLFPVSRSIKPWYISEIFTPCRMSDTPFSRSAPKQAFLFTLDKDFVFVRLRGKNSFSYFKALIKDLCSFSEVKNDSKK